MLLYLLTTFNTYLLKILNRLKKLIGAMKWEKSKNAIKRRKEYFKYNTSVQELRMCCVYNITFCQLPVFSIICYKYDLIQMENSMIRQLNPLVTSNVQYSRASFIHTVYENDFNQLRKSRIQNLPNYRKQDLSGKLNFVVVFQAIQIQRLSVEIQTLRMKIKDFQRQICNYENYEVQIRELTEKCHSYQMQRQDRQQDMQKMNKICQQLYNELEEMRARYADIDLSLKQKYRLQKERCESLSHELQKWKARYNASETSKVKQLQDMKMMLQNQRKSMLQRQIREMSVKYQSQRSILQNQLRKSRENLQNRNFQVQRMRMEIQQCKVRQGELRQYQSRLDEYEGKLMMMAQQNMRLNELLRMKKQQIQALKNNERNLQNKISNSKRFQDELIQVNKKIQNYETQIRDWNQKYSRLETENNRNQILSNKAQQYERLLDNSAEEMEKMNTIIREKISQNQKWKGQNQMLLIELDQARTAETKITQYEDALTQIATENERLNQVLKSRLEEIQSWKAKYTEVQSKIQLLNQTQNECKNLKQKLIVQVNTRARLSQTISTLEKDLAKAAEIEEAWIKEKTVNKDLQRQIERLNGSIRGLSSQNNDFSKKIQSLQTQLKDNTDFVNELNECKRKISLMTQQIDRINGVIHEKVQQIKQLKQSYNSVSINTARYRQIQEQFVVNLQQTEKLVLRLDQSRRQNEFVQQKLLNSEGRCKKLESELFTNNEQKQKLIAIVNQKKVELQDLVARMQKANQKISALQQLQQEHKNLKVASAQIQQRCKDLQQRYSKQTKRSEDFSNQVQSLTVEIMKLKSQSNFSKQFIAEFANLKAEAEDKNRLIQSLLQKVASVEKYILLLKQQNKKHYNNMCIQQNKWKTLSENFQPFLGFVDKMLEMQGRIQKLSEENLKLEGSVNIMNIQMAQSQYASQNSYKKIEEHRAVSYPKYEKEQKPLTKSPSAKLFEITQEQALYKPISSARTSNQNGSNSNLNYYESQVTELYGNGYTPPSYSNSNVQQTTTYWQRNQGKNYGNSFGNSNYIENSFKISEAGNSNVGSTNIGGSSNIGGSNAGGISNSNVGGNVTYTVKTLRPGSQQSSSTYTYVSSNYGNYGNSSNANNNGNVRPNSSYGIDSVNPSNYSNMNHMNYHFSNVTSGTGGDRPGTFVKQASKNSVTEVKTTSPDMKSEQNQSTYQNYDGRRYVLSPVRFLN